MNRVALQAAIARLTWLELVKRMDELQKAIVKHDTRPKREELKLVEDRLEVLIKAGRGE